MKRTIAILLTVLLAAFHAGKGITQEAAWILAEDATVTEETCRLVNDSLNGLVGVEYIPVTYLGFCRDGQKTTHAILCQAWVVVPDAKPRFVLFYVLEDEQGNTELLKIADFDIGLLLRE